MRYEKRSVRSDSTFLGNVLPVPIVKLDLCARRFANQLLRVFGPERSITAKEYVGDDAEGAVNVN